MLSRLPTERKVELQSINHADHRLPGTPGSMVPADGLPGTRRSSAASSTSSSRRSGGAQEPGGVTESELEEDLRRLLSLMDDAEEAVEEQQKAKRAKKKQRKKVGPPTCSGAWWGARKRRPLTLAILNNLFLVISGFFLSAYIYEIDTGAGAGTLDVQALRVDGLQVHSARPVVLSSSSGTSATVRAPTGRPTVVRIGESTFGSVGGGRGLALEPGGESWAGGAPGPGGMLAIGDVGGDEPGSLDTTLTSENGAVRVGPFVMRRDSVENIDGDLVLQSSGGAGGVLMLAPEGQVVMGANVTVAGSLSVDGLMVDVSEHGVSTGSVQLHAELHAGKGVTVQSGDLIVDEGYFVTGEGIDLNVTGALSVGGSVTIVPPNPETSNRTGGNLSVVGALRVRGERGVDTTTMDATGHRMHSVGGIVVEGQANFSGNVKLGYGPGSQLEIMSETTHLDTFTTRSFATLGSMERSDADIAFHTGSFVMMSTLGADAFRVSARSDEPDSHGVVTGGSFDGLGNFTCPSSVILGDENSDSITVRGLLTLFGPISCGRSLTVEGPAHIGSPELPVGWTAESLECSQGLQAIVRGWALSPRLKLVRTETVTFNMLAERPVGPKRIEFGANTRDASGIYRARAVLTGDVSAHNLSVSGNSRWGGSASIGGDLSIAGETQIGGGLMLGKGFRMDAGKTALWRGQMTFRTHTCEGGNPTPQVVGAGLPSSQLECESTGYSWDGAACSDGLAVDEPSCLTTGNAWVSSVTAQVRRRSGDMTLNDLSVAQDTLLSEATTVHGDVTITPADPAQLGLSVPRLDVALGSGIGGSVSIGKNLDNGGSMAFGGSAVAQDSVAIGGGLEATGSIFFINGSGVSQFIADVRGDVETVGSMYVGGATTIGGDVEFGRPDVETNWTLNASIACESCACGALTVGSHLHFYTRFEIFADTVGCVCTWNRR
jgi:hypothetical protein